MEVIKGIEHINVQDDSAVCIGNFDGLHLGHRLILATLEEQSEKKGLKSIIFTFEPHPFKFFNKDIKLISTPKKREEKFLAQKIDYLISADFNSSLSQLSAESFFKDIIVDKLKAKVVIVGDDYRFGSGKGGDTNLLIELGKKYNVEIIVAEKLQDNKGNIISSSRIRSLIIDGNVEEVAKLLKCPYSLEGIVIHGDKRGRKIGYPTINLDVVNEVLPANGVYASKVIIKNKIYNSMAYVGYIPTINNNMELRVEANIFEFNEDVYGEYAEIILYKHMRGDIKFNSIVSLIDQMGEDKAKVMAYLNHVDEYNIC